MSLIESCCTSLEAALAAQARGAGRIELCTDLSVGGVTPPRDLIRDVVAALVIPVNVLIRPAAQEPGAYEIVSREHATLGTVRGRGPSGAWEGSSEARRPGRQSRSASCATGRTHVPDWGFTAADFVYGEQSLQQMISDIEYCKSVGAAGIVVGTLTPEGRIDVVAMQRLIAAARGTAGSRALPVTFHRAFDVSLEDPFAALDLLADIGCERILTSGRAATAWEGRSLIAALVRYAAGRIRILPGSGIRPDNLAALQDATGAAEFHGTAIP